MARLPRFDVPQLIAVMGEPVTSASVVELFGTDLERMNRDDFSGDLSYGSDGVGIVFREARYLFDSEAFVDSQQLHLAAAHLYRGLCAFGACSARG